MKPECELDLGNEMAEREREREREREEGGRGAVVAIECAWLLQLTDN